MEICQLSEMQLEAIVAAAQCSFLIQIQPNKEMDPEEVFKVWSARVWQVADLVGMGFLEEKPTEKDENINILKVRYPGRTFRLFVPTLIAVQMFGSPFTTNLIH